MIGRSVGGDENPRIDGVKRHGDAISTAFGSMLFAGREKRGGMGEPLLRLFAQPKMPPGIDRLVRNSVLADATAGRKEIYQQAER